MILSLIEYGDIVMVHRNQIKMILKIFFREVYVFAEMTITLSKDELLHVCKISSLEKSMTVFYYCLCIQA